MAHTTQPLPRAWFDRQRFNIFLALLTTAMFALIELKHPYFFLNADNLNQNLPYYVHNYRALLAGEFPLFNFHQFLGTPVLSCIQSAAFYLPNYLAVFLSSLLFGNYYATIEFIAALHLILASLWFFRLMRYFGLENWSCCFGAIAWTFCGFVVVNGNVNIMLVSYAAYFPLLLLYSLMLAREFSLRNFIIATILRAIIIFVGSPPYFIYIFTFELLTVTLIYFATTPPDIDTSKDSASSRQSKTRSFCILQLKQASSYLCAFIVAAPLLLPALHQIKLSANRNVPLTWEEYSAVSYGVKDWLNGLFLPVPEAHDIYTDFGLKFLSHVGWLTLVFALAAVMVLWKRDANRIVWVFLLLATFSFLWANNTVITKLFYYIPFYNRQRWPFKIAYFTSFFIIVISSFGFDYWLRKAKNCTGRCGRLALVIVPLLLALHIGNFLGICLTSPQLSLVLRRTKPPVYDEPLADTMKNGRIVSLVRSNSGNDLLVNYGENYDNTRFLGFNYATLFGLYHLAGYEVLVAENNLKHALMLNNSAYLYLEEVFDPAPQDLAYFRTWGVRWYVAAKDVAVATSNPLQVFYSDSQRSVMYDPEAKPLVFWSADAREGGIRYRFTTNSVIVATQRDRGGQIIVNVLFNPYFKASIDGRNVALNESADNQMMVDIPAGRHELKITFVDPKFYNGMYISIGFLMLISVGGLVHCFKTLRLSQAE